MSVPYIQEVVATGASVLAIREIPTERFEPLIGTTEAAKLLHIHPKTLQRMARLSGIPGHQIGRQWRFRASELDAWLRNAVSSPVPLVPLK
jgi:excisionase family DNA binding protein